MSIYTQTLLSVLFVLAVAIPLLGTRAVARHFR